MMSKPKITDDMLMDYLDGNLGGDAHRLIEAHKNLPEITERLHEFARLNALLGDHFVMDTPNPGFSHKLMESVLALQVTAAPRSNRNISFVMGIAIIILLAGAFFGVQGISDMEIQLPRLDVQLDYRSIFYGILTMLLLSVIWMFDKVWVQSRF